MIGSYSQRPLACCESLSSRIPNFLSGDDTIALYRLMENLREQARAVGGDVLSHLGNHEYMNAIGIGSSAYRYRLKAQL